MSPRVIYRNDVRSFQSSVLSMTSTAARASILSNIDAQISNGLRCRVAILTNIPAPYRLEFFRLLSEQHDLMVFFDAPSEPNRSWDTPRNLAFPHVYLKGDVITYQRKRPDAIPEDQRFRHVPYDLLVALRRFHPDLIVSAELGFRTLQASLYATFYKIPLVIWWEGTPHTEGWVRPYRKLLRRYLVRRARRFWSNGDESSQLLQCYGAEPSSIDNGMIGIDTRHFKAGIEYATPSRDRTRKELGISGVTFLYAGQFVKRKGIVEYLKALDVLCANTTANFSLLFVGNGPEKRAIDSWKQTHPGVRVSILGFLQPDELPRIYTACDVFVLPTLDDNWSLAALEAAVAGMPQILSVYNGASRDLLAYHAPGICINPNDTHAFAQALKSYVERAPQCADNNTIEKLARIFSAEAVTMRASQSIIAAARVNA
jgi:glycosyltransferase involved in cell wall biosynthesis